MQLNKIFAGTSLLKFLFISVLILSTLIFLKVLTYEYYPDFSNFYYSPIKAFNTENPYLGGKNFFTPSVYPPPVIVLFFPFTFFSFFIAQKIFLIISILSLLLSVSLLFKLFRLKPFSVLGLFFILLVLNYFPEKFTLGMGQINNVVLLMITLFIYFYIKKREVLSGVFLAVAIAIKLFPILLIIYLIIQKKWKAFFAVIFTLSTITLLSFIFLPPSISSYFITNVFPILLKSWKGDYYNQSFSGFLIRELGSFELANIIRPIVSGVLVAFSLSLVWIFRNNKKSKLLSISLLITVNLIVNNFSWQHHFVWLLIPLFINFYFIKDNHLINRGFYLVIGVSYLLTAVNIKNPSSFPSILQSHVLYGAIILYTLNAYLLIKKTK